MSAQNSSSRATPAALLGFSFLAAALPLLLIAFVNRVPTSVFEKSLQLTGSWKAIESDAVGLEQPSVDDLTWPEVSLPGPLNAKLPGADFRGWLRKTFEWEAQPNGENYFFNLGNFRNGIAELFVNGVSVGRNASVGDDFQPDWAAISGWEVPAPLIHAGSNLLALKVSRGTGVVDQRILFGPARELRHFNAQIRSASALFSYGSIFLCAFLCVLILALLPSAQSDDDRKRFRAVFGVVAGAVVYNLSVTGAPWLFLTLPLWFYGQLVLGAMALLSAAMCLYAERRFLGRTTRVFAAHVVICVALTIAGWVSSTAVMVELMYFGLFLNYVMVVAIRAVWREPRGAVPLTAFALILVNVVGISDLLGNFGLSHLPALAPQAITDLAIIASATVIAEFIQISRRNQVLSSSLAVTNSDLGSALSLAQEATRLKSQLLATVSHELRTPLNSIINVPDGLLEDFEKTTVVKCEQCGRVADAHEATQRCSTCMTGTLRNRVEATFTGDATRTMRYLTNIRDAGSHLLAIVNDLLDFSKLNASKFVLSLETLELSSFLESLKGTVEPLARAQQLQFEFPEAPCARPLRADPVRIRQILLNLLGNAIKFSKPGGKVSLRVEEVGDDCVFHVTDQGIGIAKEHHSLIFESFRQVDGSHTRRFGGTGLGLSIARELVVLHGGVISVDSTAGIGSTFSVRIPFAGPALAQTPSSVNFVRDAQRTVLIVEDDLITLETIKLALAPLGCALVGSTDALSARRLIAELKPDVVVLDVMLGGASGLDLLRELRSSPATRQVRATVTSAALESRESALELGAEWVPKPWSGTELQDAVARQLRLS